MRIRKIITLSASFLALIGVGMVSSHVPAHAGGVATTIRYTNGRDNYFYPYHNTGKQFWFHDMKIGTMIHKKTPLARKYRVNTPIRLMVARDFYQLGHKGHKAGSFTKPQLIPIHHHKYYLVRSIANKKGVEISRSLDGRHGKYNFDYTQGYMNPKDFSQHKIKIRKHHTYRHRHARRHAHKTHHMNRDDRKMQHIFLKLIKERRPDSVSRGYIVYGVGGTKLTPTLRKALNNRWGHTWHHRNPEYNE